MARGGRIAGITIEIDGDASKFQSEIKKIDKSLKGTQSSLKDINKLLKLNPGNTELLTQKQKSLKKAIDETKERLKQLREAAKNATPESLGEEKYDALQREIIDTENKLKDLSKEMRNFGSVSAQKIAAVGEKMKALGTKMQDVGRTLTTHVTLPLVAMGTVSAKKFADVDKTMQLTNATMSNTAEQAELLNDAMKEAAANSTFGMSDAATATLNFARAGLTAEEAAAALAPAMNLAAAEGGDLDTVSSGLVATINGFGDTFDNAATYADVFANACNNSALDVNSLSEAMSVAAPIFSAAGYNVNDAALYMGVMADNGIEASVAANSLKTGFARLVDPPKQAAAQLDEFNWSITNADGSMKDSAQIQKELHDKFAELSEAEQLAAASAIFGKNQMAPWLALINTAPEDVDELSESLKVQGTTTAQAEAMMSGFGGSIEKLKSSVDVAATSLGEALAPTIQKVADVVQKAVDWFNSLDGNTQTIIATVGLAVAALGPLLLVFGKIVYVVGTLMTAWPMLVGAIGAISGPVLVVVGVIAGLIAIGVLLWKNWDTVKEKATALKDKIFEEFDRIKQKVTDAINGVAAKFTEIKNKVSSIMTQVQSDISNKITAAKNKVSTVVNAIKNVLSFSGLATKVSGVFSSISSTISSKMDSAKTAVSNAISSIKNILSGSINFPHINLPHFHVSGGVAPYGLGGKGSLPSFSVEWYKKAMNQPYILDGATIFGMMNGKMLGGGEAGKEVILGYDQFRKMGGTNVAINMTVNAAPGMNETELANMVARKINRQVKELGAVW